MTYSWASRAIDQNERLGMGAPTRFCSSKPLTTTVLASGAPWPGGGTTSQAIRRLKARAAQYGGRMRLALRCANRETSSRQPLPAGDRASEKPDSTMKTTTAKRP